MNNLELGRQISLASHLTLKKNEKGHMIGIQTTDVTGDSLWLPPLIPWSPVLPGTLLTPVLTPFWLQQGPALIPTAETLKLLNRKCQRTEANCHHNAGGISRGLREGKGCKYSHGYVMVQLNAANLMGPSSHLVNQPALKAERASARFQPAAAIWESQPTVGRTSGFSKELEIWIYVYNLLIFVMS